MRALPRIPDLGHIVANRYLLLRRLGDGGMASVYEAQHQRLGIPVALKFLHPRLLAFPALVDRFLQEARIVARIRSPHVVQVLDVDQEPDGLAFIVLEHLAGSTLRAREDALPGRRLPVGDALCFVGQLCDGLEAVHAAGIVHRDLKPDNVMITTGQTGAPRLSLLDFGIAMPEAAAASAGRPGTEGAVLGTPEYMAPEQLTAADAVDLRADIFSLGVLAYEMLSGRLPASGEVPRVIAARHAEGRIPRLDALVPELSPEIVAAVHRAMAPRPEDRFASVIDLRAALAPWIPVAVPSPMSAPSPVSEPTPPARTEDASDSLPTTVEAPWFNVEPPASIERIERVDHVEQVERVAAPPGASKGARTPGSAPKRGRMAVLVAAALLALGAVGVVAQLGVRGAAPALTPGLAEAMLAAPSTEVEADPPAPEAVPEVTPAAPVPSIERPLAKPIVLAPVTRAAPPSPPLPAPAPPPPPAALSAPVPAPLVVTGPSCHDGAPERTRPSVGAPPVDPGRRAPRVIARDPRPSVPRFPEPVFASPPVRIAPPLPPPPRRRAPVGPIITLYR